MTVSVTHCSHVGVLSVAIHKQHTDRPAEDGKHGQVRPGQVRGGGYSHSVPGQDTHTVGRQGAHAQAVRRAAGCGRPVAARAHPRSPPVAATVEAVEGVCRP